MIEGELLQALCGGCFSRLLLLSWVWRYLLWRLGAETRRNECEGSGDAQREGDDGIHAMACRSWSFIGVGSHLAPFGLWMVILFSVSATLIREESQALGDCGALTLKVLFPFTAFRAPAAVTGRSLTNFQLGL